MIVYSSVQLILVAAAVIPAVALMLYVYKADKLEKEPTTLLWRLLLLTISKKGHSVTFRKVKGHSDHPENNRCDALARGAIQQYLTRNPDLGDAEHVNIQHS